MRGTTEYTEYTERDSIHRQLHPYVRSHVLRIRIERGIAKTELAIEPDRRDLLGIRFENDARAITFPGELDTRLHQLVAYSTAAKLWIHRHLRQLK